ncbi:hypothetical protein Hdeb2414_s0019g00547071 [Helianthus debilis subsp. tardiflorus]
MYFREFLNLCSNTFIETLWQQLFKPSLSTIISGNPKVLKWLPLKTSSVYLATRRMTSMPLVCCYWNF